VIGLNSTIPSATTFSTWLMSFGSLAARVERHLEADMNGKKLSPAKRYMKIMARSVVEAMYTGSLLRGALARNLGKAYDVFVNKQSSSTEIFTSWHSGIDIDGRWRKIHVPLTFICKTMKFAPVGHREVGEWTVLLRVICQDQGRFQVATRMDRKQASIVLGADLNCKN
jgi:hypothetical protein